MPEKTDDVIQTALMLTLAVTASRESIRPSEFDRENLGHVLANGDWWSADLFRLIAKSDPLHLAAISLVFPSHVAAYEAWYATENKEQE